MIDFVPTTKNQTSRERQRPVGSDYRSAGREIWLNDIDRPTDRSLTVAARSECVRADRDRSDAPQRGPRRVASRLLSDSILQCGGGTRRGRAKAGFTIIELITSVGLVVLITGLVGVIFNDTTQAVRRGADTSQIIAQSRTISDQLIKDTKNMLVYEDQRLRPGEPGAFMVLIQQVNTNVRFPDDPENQRQFPDQWPAANAEDIRTDQLVFFRKAANLQPVTPGSSASYDSQAQAGIARVWYGHLSRDDGSSTPTEPGFAPNQTIVDLLLGRQALLLVEDSNQWPDGSPGLSAPAANTVYANGLPHTTSTSGANPIHDSPVIEVSSGTIGALDEALTDVLRINFTDLMQNDTQAGAGAGVTNSYGTEISNGIDPNSKLPSSTYQDAAITWAYPLGERLLADSFVPISPGGGRYLETFDVAKTHPVFVPYVSDFQIDFAADISDDYDYTTSGDPSTKTWVGIGAGTDNLPDGEPDTVGENGPVRWYNLANPNPDGPFDGTGQDGTGDNFAEQPISWGLPAAALMHSQNLATVGVSNYPPFYSSYAPTAGVGASAILVFAHTGDSDSVGGETDPYTYTSTGANNSAGLEAGSAKWWPYMLRVRYRLHDRDATFNEADPTTGVVTSGRWFEQIIPIPRPE
jgi:hypothetical protein